MSAIRVCHPKSLPLEKHEAAARRAIELNPANAIERRSVARTPIGRWGGPRRIAVVVARKWPASGVRLSVSFMDSPPKALRSRILEHMNSWGASANVLFSETKGVGQVRIARLDSPAEMAGYWSYIGTEILEVEDDEPTLNLEGFTTTVSEAEFRRVVRHEAGHTLGFEHEHMRSDLVKQIDRKKAIAYFDSTQGWSPEEVEEQVLTPLATKSIMGTTESDPLSIMCYQLPAKIMKKGKAAIPGGKDINAKDSAFAAKLYPKKSKATAGPASASDTPGSPPPTLVAMRDSAGTDVFHLMILDEVHSKSERRNGVRPTPEFARIVATYGGATVISPLRLHASEQKGPPLRGDTTAWGRIIGMHKRIRAYTNENKGSLPHDTELLEFGSDLFQTLFDGDVRRLYDEARARERRRLDIVLTSKIDWIAAKPWEFAYDKDRRTFLATEETHFVRNVVTAMPSDPIQRSSGPLRVLVAAAQPVGFEGLSVEQEVAVIRRGFEPLVEEGLATVDVRARASPGDIQGYLSSGGYQVVHFIGHGEFEGGQGYLVFETKRGQEYRLGERDARQIFCGRGLSLVFLNACETGRGGRADFNKGIAQSFVEHGLPAVVANQYSVLDSSATAFAQHFYWCLGRGMSLGQSAREARIAVNYSMNGEPIDWAVPVVYARDPHATLCEVPAVRSRVPATAVRPSLRRALAGRAVRIAVWDMDGAFPGLERTLDTLNAVQSVFGFEVVDLSVPLDVRDHKKKRPDGAYLNAERLAGRLGTKPAELGVDVLACLTRHWMEGSGHQNIYGWWPDNKTPPIVIFSAAGFDELEPEGRTTDRVIANALVAQLAGFLGNFDTHTRRSTCPMWFNEKRDFAYLAGLQEFDAQCRRRLERLERSDELLPALDLLLQAFNEGHGD